MTSDDALAFDRHLDATAPAVADIARALRLTVLEGFPDAVETFDAADGLLAIGTGRSMRAFSFATLDKARARLKLEELEKTASPSLPALPPPPNKFANCGFASRSRAATCSRL